jgi:hypothetical protein
MNYTNLPTPIPDELGIIYKTLINIRLDPERTTEPPGAIVGFCTVVVYKYMIVAAIAEDGAA